MQVGDLIMHNGWGTVGIVLFVGEEAIKVLQPSTQKIVWINNFIWSSDLEVLCKSDKKCPFGHLTNLSQ